jgi:hypothetical protein
MLEHLLAVMQHPDAYVCAWRNGELYIEPAETHNESAKPGCAPDDAKDEKIAA